MNYNFCTLFDKNYIYKGLALHNSLVKHCDNFKLWILCMDNEVYKLLNEIKLKNTHLIKLEEFEDEDLKKIKSSRSNKEYCGTSKASLVLFVLSKHPEIEIITFLDGDLFFYSNPEPLYKEISKDSILIGKHYHSKEFLHIEKVSGIYNSGMIIFRNDNEGNRCLETWRKQCIDWCFWKKEAGRYSDQMYLNDWPQKFKRVKILQHKGANVAPWNIRNYKVSKKNDMVYVNDIPLIFYHFHRFKIYGPKSFNLAGGYNDYLSREIRNLIYQPYQETMSGLIKKYQNSMPPHTGFQKRKFWSEVIKPMLARIKKSLF